jgi:type VI secretion system protein ImpM
MRCSLFGKLSAKRDFIALSASRDFLNAWEPWMQACVSASRDTLRDHWLQAYLTAPIWRFWLGEDICGATTTGALMSSLDGLGRYYPLTLFASATPGNFIAPPDIDSHDRWFAAAEAFLLSTLEKEVRFETITNTLEHLPMPFDPLTDPETPGLSIFKNGAVGASLGSSTFSDLFTALRVANHSNVYSGSSFWWTVGGSESGPVGFCCRRMPGPFLFANMLTGRIDTTTA